MGAVIPPGSRIMCMGRPVGATQEFQMMLCMASGEREEIGQQDAEIVLNDGILYRMKIKVEFLKKA